MLCRQPNAHENSTLLRILPHDHPVHGSPACQKHVKTQNFLHLGNFSVRRATHRSGQVNFTHKSFTALLCKPLKAHKSLTLSRLPATGPPASGPSSLSQTLKNQWSWQLNRVTNFNATKLFKHTFNLLAVGSISRHYNFAFPGNRPPSPGPPSLSKTSKKHIAFLDRFSLYRPTHIKATTLSQIAFGLQAEG